MTTSTIENMEGIDSIDICKIPTGKLENMLDAIDKRIEKDKKDRYTILDELSRRDND